MKAYPFLLFPVILAFSCTNNTQLQNEITSLRVELKEVKRERDELMKAREDDFEQYEKIREHVGKTALSKVEGEFCGGCNMHLRPQIINDAKLKKTLMLCENCGRILYAD